MIRFPKMHIAASVVNAIQNVADELSFDALPSTVHAPAVPEPSVKGAALDAALATEPQGVSLPQGAEPDMALAGIEGASPMGAAVARELTNGTGELV